MSGPEPPVLPKLAYGITPAPLTVGEVGRAVLPSLVSLAVGVLVPFAIEHWLRVRYGPNAITQWTANAARVEFWCLDVPIAGWLVLWAIVLTLSLRRCTTAAGRHLSILASLLALLVGGLSWIMIMESPFP